jgi:putative two-component system response regulator
MSGELILVVEDNDSLREGICEMLALEGYHVVEARNGIEAVKALYTSTPELILSDVMMPEMDGFDFYSMVRARTDLISIPFIFLTARTDPADLMKGRVLGADDYLAKPITRDELVTAIRSRLSRYSQVKFAQVQQAYQASLTMLAGAIESRGPNMYGHIERLTETALLLAAGLEWKERALNQLRFGAILHDIGKIHVPDKILTKKEPLTEEEWEEIKRHPGAGAEMVRGIPFLSEVAPLIRHHHENWNGEGYPDRLSGESIPAGARILAVVDSFDAMTSERVYANRLTLQEAHDEILCLEGIRYDPEVVDCFEKTWNSERIHSLYQDT